MNVNGKIPGYVDTSYREKAIEAVERWTSSVPHTLGRSVGQSILSVEKLKFIQEHKLEQAGAIDLEHVVVHTDYVKYPYRGRIV